MNRPPPRPAPPPPPPLAPLPPRAVASWISRSSIETVPVRTWNPPVALPPVIVWPVPMIVRLDPAARLIAASSAASVMLPVISIVPLTACVCDCASNVPMSDESCVADEAVSVVMDVSPSFRRALSRPIRPVRREPRQAACRDAARVAERRGSERKPRRRQNDHVTRPVGCPRRMRFQPFNECCRGGGAR